MGKEAFNQSDVYPTNELLAKELGTSFLAYNKFLFRLEREFPLLTLSFHFYTDTKSWLGKAEVKKKTVFWLSFWSGYFQLSFFFNQKTLVLLSKESRKLILEEHLAKKNPPIIQKIFSLEQIDQLFIVIKEKIEIIQRL